MVVTSGAGTAYTFGAPEFTLGFNGFRVTLALIFSVVFCRSLFVLLVIVLSVFRITDSDYPFVSSDKFYSLELEHCNATHFDLLL